MEFELKKTQLTLLECAQIVNDAVDVCFTTDEEGNDIDFMPIYKQASLQLAFCEHYLGLEFSDNFDESYATYMAVDIDWYIRNKKTFNSDQWYSILHSVNEQIDFRKQKLLQSQTPLNELFKELTSLVHNFGESINTSDIATLLPELAKLSKFVNGLNQKELVEQILNNGNKVKQTKTKSTKNSKSNLSVVEKVGE